MIRLPRDAAGQCPRAQPLRGLAAKRAPWVMLACAAPGIGEAVRAVDRFTPPPTPPPPPPKSVMACLHFEYE